MDNIWVVYGYCMDNLYIYIHWLVLWNMTFIFPYIGNLIIPIDSYFSEGFKPPTRLVIDDATNIQYWMNPPKIIQTLSEKGWLTHN